MPLCRTTISARVGIGIRRCCARLPPLVRARADVGARFPHRGPWFIRLPSARKRRTRCHRLSRCSFAYNLHYTRVATIYTRAAGPKEKRILSPPPLFSETATARPALRTSPSESPAARFLYIHHAACIGALRSAGARKYRRKTKMKFSSFVRV